MLGWRKLLGVVLVDAVLFALSGVMAQSSRHSGTLSNVLWVDFLIGVLAVIVLVIANGVRSALTVRRHR